MPITPDLIGRSSEPLEYAWSHTDTMLYAVAVGAGQPDPTTELNFTTENSEGVKSAVLPTFANIIASRARVDMGDYDSSKLVHAEQAFELPAPLPLSGTASVVTTVAGVFDKGNAVLVETETVATDIATKKVLARTVRSVFIRGEGGFGGPRGRPTDWAAPERPADHEISYTTRPEQALIYRLTGDRNPLHNDPTFAARGGFDRPILHGMCTYGFTGRAVLNSVCDGDPSRFRAMEARFTRPVMPGDVLTVLIWQEGETAYFRTLRNGEPVLDRGRVTIGA